MVSSERDLIVEAPPSGGASHFGAKQWQALLEFAQLLEAEGELRGLLGPRELQRLWSRHILNCTALFGDLPENSEIADIGAGAGFPSIVIAAARPDVRVTAIETMDRRAQWLEYVASKLELNNFTLIHKRAELLHGQRSFQFVTARAVAPLKKLVPWALPLVTPAGSLLAFKGAKAEAEIDAASSVFKKHGVAWVDIYERPVWGTDEATRIVELHKR